MTPTSVTFATDLWGTADVVDSSNLPSGFDEHAILSRNDAIILLPMPPRRAGAAAVMRWTDGMSLGTVASRIALGLALRTGIAAPLLKRRIGIRVDSSPGGSQTLHEYLADVFDVDCVALASAWGPPRPNRKPVIRVFDSAANTLGFVKVGWNELTKELVETESQFLTSAPRTSLVRIPTLRHRGTWRNQSLSITEPLVGGISRHGASAPGAAVIREVVQMTDRYRSTLASSPYRTSISERFGDGTPTDAARALGRVDAEWSDREIDFGHWHGDWTPWNMNSSGSQLVVWDWERTGPSVPVGFDPLHYHFHSALAAGSSAAEALTKAVSAARPVLHELGLSDQAVPAVAMLYAIEMRTRFDAESSGVKWVDGLLDSASAQFSG